MKKIFYTLMLSTFLLGTSPIEATQRDNPESLSIPNGLKALPQREQRSFSVTHDPSANIKNRLKSAETLLNNQNSKIKTFGVQAYLFIAQDSNADSYNRMKAIGVLYKKQDSKIRASAAQAYLSIAQDPHVEAYYRIKAADILFKNQDLKIKILGSQAYLSIAQDSNANMNSRMKAADILFNDSNSKINPLGRKAYFAIAKKPCSDTDNRLCAAGILFNNKDPKIKLLGGKAYLAIAQCSSVNAKKSLEIANILSHNQDPEIKKLGEQAYLSISKRANVEEKNSVEVANTVFKNSDTEIDKLSFHDYLAIVQDSRTQFDYRMKVARILFNSHNPEIHNLSVQDYLSTCFDSFAQDSNFAVGKMIEFLKILDHTSIGRILKTTDILSGNNFPEIKKLVEADYLSISECASVEEEKIYDFQKEYGPVLTGESTINSSIWVKDITKVIELCFAPSESRTQIIRGIGDINAKGDLFVRNSLLDLVDFSFSLKLSKIGKEIFIGAKLGSVGFPTGTECKALGMTLIATNKYDQWNLNDEILKKYFPKVNFGDLLDIPKLIQREGNLPNNALIIQPAPFIIQLFLFPFIN